MMGSRRPMSHSGSVSVLKLRRSPHERLRCFPHGQKRGHKRK